MASATGWLQQRAVFPKLFDDIPDNQTGIIVVVPAFDEPDITVMLDSLASCSEPSCRAEVIIIVNAPPGASLESIHNNSECVKNIVRWREEHKHSFFRLNYFDAGTSSVPGWGAGLARKAGMDEALRRLDSIDNLEGIIVSLDADCTVNQNYFTSICDELYDRKDRKACALRFEHPLSGPGFSDEVYAYAAMYELHMRYFYQAVKYSGYPYTFHTIGSAIAFRASSYLKAGGMNRKMAGEDFYFIQKLVPQGGFFELNSTVVHPSPRTSSRVPFGTGTVISKMIDGSRKEFLSYNPAAFQELHDFFSGIKGLWILKDEEIPDFYSTLPAGIRSFISHGEWVDRIKEIKGNTSGESSFIKRFFMWFNMFRIVKFLNHVHLTICDKVPVAEAASFLLSEKGFHPGTKDPRELLKIYRSLEMPG
jgi:hypothetical protein